MEEGVFPGMQSIYNPEEVEEERRLCYVAITRAKEELVLLNADSRMIFGSTSRNRASRFLDEIPPALMEHTRSHDWSRPAQSFRPQGGGSASASARQFGPVNRAAPSHETYQPGGFGEPQGFRQRHGAVCDPHGQRQPFGNRL